MIYVSMIWSPTMFDSIFLYLTSPHLIAHLLRFCFYFFISRRKKGRCADIQCRKTAQNITLLQTNKSPQPHSQMTNNMVRQQQQLQQVQMMQQQQQQMNMMQQMQSAQPSNYSPYGSIPSQGLCFMVSVVCFVCFVVGVMFFFFFVYLSMLFVTL